MDGPPAQPADVSSSPRRALAGIREYTAADAHGWSRPASTVTGSIHPGDRSVQRFGIGPSSPVPEEEHGSIASLVQGGLRPSGSVGRLLPVIPGADPGGRE